MGNKLGRRRQVVDEKYTRPQGLYQHNDVDHKKLRKLILDSKLAPCYPGEEECLCDLEECPICFLYYPSLNRSRCCMKRICTECFLRMKTPYATRPTQCPFCKMSNYAVEYRGSKTKEEKGTELIEEQRVIEAKIRMRQQELQDEEERIQKRQETSSSSRIVTPGEAEIEYNPVADEQIISSQYASAASTIRQPLRRNDEFDLDLEDIMVMEAIWLSIQENGRLRNTSYGDAVVSEQYIQEDCHIPAAVAPLAESSSSPSGGLACAIAALAERQQMSGESSSNYSGNTSASRLLHGCSSFSKEEQVTQNYSTPGSSIEVSPANRMEATRDDGEWGVDHVSEMAEMGTSYASSDAAADDAGGSVSLPQQEEIGGCFQTVAGPIVPDSFEEQMMLAMAVSLAEAGARTY